MRYVCTPSPFRNNDANFTPAPPPRPQSPWWIPASCHSPGPSRRLDHLRISELKKPRYHSISDYIILYMIYSSYFPIRDIRDHIIWNPYQWIFLYISFPYNLRLPKSHILVEKHVFKSLWVVRNLDGTHIVFV